jgi:hypothetical protein
MSDLASLLEKVTVDELAQIIRRVDGNHSLGAGELAEAILAALSPPIKAGEAVPVGGAKLSRFGLDATDVDMLRRGDMLGGKAGAKFFDAVSALCQELEDADSLVDKATAWDAIAEKNARIATLTEKVARMGEALEQLVPFAKWAIRESAFSGHELDGGEVQEKALAHCLIVRTVYDPQQHGPSDVASAGDEWFEFSSTIAEPRP